jgi:hypothetical protein
MADLNAEQFLSESPMAQTMKQAVQDTKMVSLPDLKHKSEYTYLIYLFDAWDD